jgi:hypothetical protein
LKPCPKCGVELSADDPRYCKQYGAEVNGRYAVSSASLEMPTPGSRAFPARHSALMGVAARLRHIASTHVTSGVVGSWIRC